MSPWPLRAAPTAGQRANRGVPVQFAGANGTCGQMDGGQTWTRRLSSGVRDRQALWVGAATVVRPRLPCAALSDELDVPPRRIWRGQGQPGPL